MALIIWSSGYSVGVDVLDADHIIRPSVSVGRSASVAFASPRATTRGT
jgi:hypothetical protein